MTESSEYELLMRWGRWLPTDVEATREQKLALARGLEYAHEEMKVFMRSIQFQRLTEQAKHGTIKDILPNIRQAWVDERKAEARAKLEATPCWRFLRLMGSEDGKTWVTLYEKGNSDGTL